MKTKINNIGTVGYIFSIILIVGVICAMVANGIGIAAASSVSKENVNVKVDSNISITSSSNILSVLDNFIGVDGVDKLSDIEENSTVKVNDNKIDSISLEKDGDAYIVNVKQDDVSFTAGRLIAALVVTFIYLAGILVMVEMLKKLMKEFKTCDTPFSEPIIKRMKAFAFSLIPYAVLSMFCESFWGYFMAGDSFDLNLSITKVFIIVFVFFLCMIFKYGAELQQQSDETL
jgi:hypothetical protein